MMSMESVKKSDSVLVEGQELAPWEILAQFLQGMLKFLGVAELVKNTKCVAVTLPGLTEIQVENFQKAFEIIGFPHEKYMLLDYGESFYYYVLSQKRGNLEPQCRMVCLYTGERVFSQDDNERCNKACHCKTGRSCGDRTSC